MKQTLPEITSLAEALGCRYLENGKVNLEKIAKNKRIQFIKNDYGTSFLGQLVHYSRKFYILLNTDQLPQEESGRIRFTIAHELGHYFIDEHRVQLAKGISLAFRGEMNEEASKTIEITANNFAAHLLMPEKIFKKLAKKIDPGLLCICELSKIFDTSIECSAIHYINLDLSASIMIRWRADLTFHYASYSKSFSKLTGIRGYPPIRFDTNYLQEQVNILSNIKGDFIESATPISRWISTISQGAKKDLIGLEQTIKLGAYGGITVLTFT